MNKKCTSKRLLCIVSDMSTGGAETFLMKIYRTIDKTKFQMDYYCMSKKEGFYENEIKLLGGTIFHSIPKSKNFIKSFIDLKNTVKKYNYNYVIRVSQHSLATLDLVAAKLGGAKILIQRSSNSNSNNKISRILHLIFKWLPMTIPTIKIAPSTEAAIYTFGKKNTHLGKVKIIKNAIPIENFIFNQKKRELIRYNLNIHDELVIGHIGRFTNQKNHSFLIEIFNEIIKKHKNSILILVGSGELENNIKSKIKNFGLSNNVIFTGIRSDIPDILMAMDIFIFPSFFEGMPNTVIEAQATGLPCIISDSITKEVKITDLVNFLSLKYEAKIWAEKAINSFNNKRNSEKHKNCIKQKFIENDYEIKTLSDKLFKYIFNSNN